MNPAWPAPPPNLQVHELPSGIKTSVATGRLIHYTDGSRKERVTIHFFGAEGHVGNKSLWLTRTSCAQTERGVTFDDEDTQHAIDVEDPAHAAWIVRCVEAAVARAKLRAESPSLPEPPHTLTVEITHDGWSLDTWRPRIPNRLIVILALPLLLAAVLAICGMTFLTATSMFPPAFPLWAILTGGCGALIAVILVIAFLPLWYREDDDRKQLDCSGHRVRVGPFDANLSNVKISGVGQVHLRGPNRTHAVLHPATLENAAWIREALIWQQRAAAGLGEAADVRTAQARAALQEVRQAGD